MSRQTLKVEGMSCDHCVQTIQSAVGGMSGISAVEVDLDKKEVTVDFDDMQSDIQEISAKIVEAGFEVAA